MFTKLHNLIILIREFDNYSLCNASESEVDCKCYVTTDKDIPHCVATETLPDGYHNSEA